MDTSKNIQGGIDTSKKVRGGGGKKKWIQAKTFRGGEKMDTSKNIQGGGEKMDTSKNIQGGRKNGYKQKHSGGRKMGTGKNIKGGGGMDTSKNTQGGMDTNKYIFKIYIQPYGSVAIYANFLPKLPKSRWTAPSCSRCSNDSKQVGASKRIRPDLVTKITRSGHTAIWWQKIIYNFTTR